MFSLMLESYLESPVLDDWETKRDYALFYNKLYQLGKVFPEILRFFITLDITILEASGVKMNYQDLEFFRSIKRKYPYIVKTCMYILSIQYSVRDIGFFSRKDAYEAKRYKDTLYPAHAKLPDYQWFGYSLPNTYNLSEAVRLLEMTIAESSHIFRTRETLKEWLVSNRVDTHFIWLFLNACLRLWKFNILPANTIEYSWISRNIFFEDIALSILNSLDQIMPWASLHISFDSIPARTVITKIKVWRELQTYNIQNACLDRSKNPDVVRMHAWVADFLNGVQDKSRFVQEAVDIFIGNINQSPPSASSRPQGPLSP